jgi:folate-binding protein YgfZ
MTKLALHEFHEGLGAHFVTINGEEAVADYGETLAEHAALRESAGVLDISFRSRICLTGADRVRFLHGQVTNDVNGLRDSLGCYAALTTAKGRMQADLNIYRLEEELLLDFEPGLTEMVSQRLEGFIVADDVQVVDVAPLYGLLSVQGPRSGAVLLALDPFRREIDELDKSFVFTKVSDAAFGEMYLMNQPRLGTRGFDLFVPTAALGALAEKLIASAKTIAGRACGWQAFEMARVEAGIPRFGADMDETNFPQECGIESRAVSYTKGCYIGQEVLNRIHTLGHVNKELRGLRLADDLKILPGKGDKLFHDGKEVGYVTSSLNSPAFKANIALGYVRNDANRIGSELVLKAAGGESRARVVELPFKSE